MLKGAGTVVASEAGEMGIIDAGNAGMASGGMGDADRYYRHCQDNG